MSVESFKAGLADILEVQEVTEQFELNPGNWDSTVQLAVIALIDENFGTTIPVKQTAFQSKSHAFQQTPVGHIGERMAVQYATEIRLELHSAGDLTQASEENCRVRHVRA